MAEVVMAITISGARGDEDWPARGEVLSCDEREAAELVAQGYATVPEKAVKEKAVKTAPERATKE